jgi:hypothetical protein
LPHEPWVSSILDDICGQIRGAGAISGIHCCAAAQPAWFAGLNCDVISFDASEDVVPTEADRSVLGDADRIMAFGLIGTSPVPDSVGEAFSRWLSASTMAGDPSALATRTILTPRCGLGRSSQSEAEAAFRAVGAVGELVRRFVS